MLREIKESDWKLLRQMVPVALDRFCQRILGELDRIGSDSTKGHHQRYLAIFAVLQRRDQEIAQAFNDLRRSTALTQLAAIYSQGLLTEEEFVRFSLETRSIIELLLAHRQA
ncbi:MAG TPA: peptide ABC transporter substrate-binding protein [Candidatus Binatia bacterium]|nr:peptide ABC transporter substrate-binding protein [Candidatus Binatia bacterium]